MASFWRISVLLVVTQAALETQRESPWTTDLDRFVDKLQRDHASFFPNGTIAKTSIEEYRRFLHMHQRYPEHWIAASKLVDLVWHEHIIDTRLYMADCDRLFGRYLHHTPCFGEGRPFNYQKHMLKAYQEVFGEFPPVAIWEMAPPRTQVTADFPGCEIPQPPGPAPPPPPCPPPAPTGFIKLASSEGSEDELCIDLGSSLGDVVTLAKCKTNANNERFDYMSDDYETFLAIDDSSSWASHERGRCVELSDGNTTNGNHFVVRCCGDYKLRSLFVHNSTTAQLQYYAKDAKCVDANSMTIGDPLIIMDCKDADQQKWHHTFKTLV